MECRVLTVVVAHSTFWLITLWQWVLMYGDWLLGCEASDRNKTHQYAWLSIFFVCSSNCCLLGCRISNVLDTNYFEITVNAFISNYGSFIVAWHQNNKKLFYIALTSVKFYMTFFQYWNWVFVVGEVAWINSIIWFNVVGLIGFTICSFDDNVGISGGVNFEDTIMMPHDNQTGRWLSSFRQVLLLPLNLFPFSFWSEIYLVRFIQISPLRILNFNMNGSFSHDIDIYQYLNLVSYKMNDTLLIYFLIE